jgi:hypothetical protein
MPKTQSLTCSLCGLRYANGTLLELHIREDHVRRDHRAPPDRSNTGDSGTCQPTPEAHRAGLPSSPVKVLPTKTPAPGSRSLLPEMAITSLTRAARAGRRAIRALRYVNEELLGASEAILRSARFPQRGPRPEAPAETDTHSSPGKTEHGNRAA